MNPGTSDRDYLDSIARLEHLLAREKDAVQGRRELVTELPGALADVAVEAQRHRLMKEWTA